MCWHRGLTAAFVTLHTFPSDMVISQKMKDLPLPPRVIQVLGEEVGSYVPTHNNLNEVI
jgi:hypothetical protein